MITRVEGLLYGAAYRPEQWPETVWRQDVNLMHDAGITMVTVGAHSWSRLQPSEDEWDFAWLDRLLDLLHSRGIAVALATATATPPAWFAHKYPDHYCPSSPIYRAAATRLARKTAQRYADHPALALWHTHNSYGAHLTECFCDASAEDFRRWLRERYGDDIGRLNFAWGSEALEYADFDQIRPPRDAPATLNPGQLLDWRRFSSDALLSCYLAERDALKKVTPGIPITTTLRSLAKDLDSWKWAASSDVVSSSNAHHHTHDRAQKGNGVASGSGRAAHHIHTALTADLARSLGAGRPWLLTGQSPASANHRLSTLQTIARGADGILHLPWRAPRSGPEKFHTALLPHAGTSSRAWQDTVRLGEELRKLTEVAGTRIESRVAIVLDWNSWWALDSSGCASATALTDQIHTWYSVLYRWNHTVDFIPPDHADMSAYKVVLVPNLYSLSTEDAARLTDYVYGGGYLAVGFFSGIVDENDHVHQSLDASGGGYPGPLKEMLGVAVDGWWPIASSGQSVEVSFTADEESAKAHKKSDYGYRPNPVATRWSEWVGTTTARAVAHYAEGPLAGRPAVTCNEFGAGRAWYVSCDLGSDIEKVLGEAVRPAVVWPSLSSTLAFTGVEVVCRSSDTHHFYFLLNHSDTAVELGSSVPFGAVNLLTGSRPASLGPHAVAVLRVPHSAA